MNYIYDIYLNLNTKLYDFFDWDKNDKIIHIKKIPIFKISEENLKIIIKNKIHIEDNYLIKLYSKTEAWNTCTKLPYCSLFTDGSNIVAVEFNDNGNSIKKSYLSIEEELEVLEIANRFEEKVIEITIVSKDKDILKTRRQLKDENFIQNELKVIDESKLNYIFFECFGKQEKNKKIILDRIKSLSTNSKAYKNLYDILKLTSTNKK